MHGILVQGGVTEAETVPLRDPVKIVEDEIANRKGQVQSARIQPRLRHIK